MQLKRILVVEDSPTQAMRLQHLLKSAEIDSLLAQSAADAIKVLESDVQWDAILSDIDMPETNGFQLCEAIKRMPKAAKVPFILLVSLKDTDDVLRAINCGADNFLMKEYDKAYFLPQLTNMCAFQASQPQAENTSKQRIFWNEQWHDIAPGSARLAALLVSAFTMAVQQKAARQPVPQRGTGEFQPFKA